jgi:hypothetical protein
MSASQDDVLPGNETALENGGKGWEKVVRQLGTIAGEQEGGN